MENIVFDTANLSATSEGYPVYKKLGFVEKAQDYTDMRMKM